ncbi:MULTISPECIES: hypothetical protein [Emticicia]|uniref:hypothetical protein n=1 Tax=Emticicia TaxID=312278 RepID=UPI00209E660A|nr:MULTISPECIES: hypothetical protein [Emticicia]UTA66701.1 hypothetical protein MB380_13935 [Emticicia sp. 21SJ11W-3]
MKKIYLLLTVLLTQFNSFAQCIEKRIKDKTTETFYLNAHKQPTKVEIIEENKTKSIANFKYDTKGNCILVNIAGKMQIKGKYNTANQLTSTATSIDKDFTIINELEYKDNLVTKIKTSVVMFGSSPDLANETNLTYENGNLTQIEVREVIKDSVFTVIQKVTYDEAINNDTKTERMLHIATYTGYDGFNSLLALSRNNPLKLSYSGKEPKEGCTSKIVHEEYDYQYDSSKRLIKSITKTTCDETVETKTTRIETTCK